MNNAIVLICYSINNVATTILIKLAGNVSIVEAGEERTFYHPLMQTWLMLVGQAICFVFYYNLQRNRQPSVDKLPSTVKLCIIPLVLDLISSVLIFVAFNYLSGSVYSILNGQIMVFTAIFSKIFLKAKIKKIHIIGSIMAVGGAILAGVGQSFADQTSEQITLLIIGIILGTISLLMQSVQYVIMQKIYGKYDITPLQMVGYEGVIGTIFWSAFMVLLLFVGCPFSSDQCVFDSDGNTHIQDFVAFFGQLASNPYLMVLNVSFVIVVARFNYDLSTVIVTMSAFTLGIIRIFSNGFVWIIGIVITLIGGDDPQFQMESLDLLVNGIKLIAFALSTFSLLIYNQIIPLNLDKKQNQELLQSHISIQSHEQNSIQ